MRSDSSRLLLAGLLGVVSVVSLSAQAPVPTAVNPVPNQTLAPGGEAVTIDVRNHFTVPGVVGTEFARFDTVFGGFSVELRNDVAPRHVANFLSYVRNNSYTNSFFHRSVSFDGGARAIVQGGGWRAPLPVTEIPKAPPIPLEANLPNSRGTLAAARLPARDSATSEWFFNVRDNAPILNQPDNSYSVFGRVLGTGMAVLDTIAALPHAPNITSPFNELPVRNYTSGVPTDANLVIVNSVTPATLFPTGGGASVISLTVTNSAPSIVSTTLSGSTLTVAPASPGTATITIRATDTNGNFADTAFSVSVAATAPVFITQPMSQTVATGSTAVFNAPAVAAAAYRWEKNGTAIEGASSASLVLNNVTAADAGRYTSFASNTLSPPGGVASDTAMLTVVDATPSTIGRLINLSILTRAGSGSKVLTMGAVIGPINLTTSLPLVIRGVGPTLEQPPFNVAGVLPDPVMTFFAQGNPTPIDQNDNWGGSGALAAAFSQVGAFALPGASADSAIVRVPGVNPGGYTVQVTGKNEASGLVIAEMYDAGGSQRTGTTPRLINLSTLTEIDAGADLAVGFVLGGQTSRTVLVRGIGPSLARFNVPGLMADPRLELFSNDTGRSLGSNDDWAGSVDIGAAAAAVGAFPLISGISKDAVMLVTLPPGAYSARVSGANRSGGTAIVEVYEVP